MTDSRSISRPTFVQFASDEERCRPLELITQIIIRLEVISIEPTDTPYLYADLLRRLLFKAGSWIKTPNLVPPRFPTGEEMLTDHEPMHGHSATADQSVQQGMMPGTDSIISGWRICGM
jgi:hypothetical protein